MAHFAELDDNNIVQRVIVVDNNHLTDELGMERENLGITFCNTLLGGRWVQTSYNNNFRKNYAGVGYTYDSIRDAFIPPKPFEGWILNEETCLWDAPISRPTDGNHYLWDETTVNWVLSD